MRSVARIAAGVVLVFAAWAALVCFPQPLFAHTARLGYLTLHSDRPLPAEAAARVMALAEAKLAKSPLYFPEREWNIYICNSRWRQMIFFNKDYGVGGVALYPITSNVFLRDARIEDNRLISPRGSPVAGDRTLDYFIAHEITHVLTGSFLGPLRQFLLPQWVREGYADYVGKGSMIDLAEYRRAFLAEEPEMNYAKSGLYRRFLLLVAWQLEHEGCAVERLLHNPPAQDQVEAAIQKAP